MEYEELEQYRNALQKLYNDKSQELCNEDIDVFATLAVYAEAEDKIRPIIDLLIENEEFDSIFRINDEIQGTHANSTKKYVKNTLFSYEYFEEACLYGVEGAEDEFIRRSPGDAFTFAANLGDEPFAEKALDELLCQERDTEDEQLLETYIQLVKNHNEYLPLFYDKVKGNISSWGYGELHQLALDFGDYKMLNIIAHEIAEDEYEEAVIIAQETQDIPLLKKIMDMNDVPYSEEYFNMIQTAFDIISSIENLFNVTLPKDIKKGGPKGSYATIRWDQFGGQYAT